MKRLFGLLICFVLFVFCPSQAQLQWVAYNGELPLTTVIGGQENGKDLAVCRAQYNDSYHAGKVVGTNCNIGWGGQEIVLQEFEVLVNPAGIPLEWAGLVKGAIPKFAVEAGAEQNRRNFVGQATREDGTVHPGKIIGEGAEAICNYGYGGAEIVEKTNFRILVAIPSLYWAAYDGTIPANAVNGGKENKKNLAVCRADYEGAMHPGKVVGTKCNIGYGQKEIVLDEFEVLLNGGVSATWALFKGQVPKGAVSAGEENGKTLYVGQMTRPDGSIHAGKIFGQPGNYILNYGYGGKEVTVKTNFRILVQR